MEQHTNPLDQHFHLPHVRRIDPSRPIAWLRMGWQDLGGNPVASLTYGVVLALVGGLILSLADGMPYLFVAAVSGFFLVGPIAAAGLYEIARREEQGEVIGFADSLRGLRGHGDQLMFFGVFLAISLLAWERLSAILFALFGHGETALVGNFFRDIFLSGAHLEFMAAYVILGGVLAAAVFALSVIAIPMLMHRDTDVVTAMMSSARAVANNLRAMALWAAIIVALIAVGFATFLIGLIVILPVLGYASWHAYRELIE
ncbi:MAG: DUF2189 domain-containing protein [Zoogloeaceae bacterium]|nr:DUF2189 domain-containing protein [Zoogloeaceae bacterium]